MDMKRFLASLLGAAFLIASANQGRAADLTLKIADKEPQKVLGD